MNVVTSAMSTSIVKSAGEITPSSRPMFSTISSVRPRVFISAPRPTTPASVAGDARATAIAASHLPAIATATDHARVRPRAPGGRAGRLGLQAGDDEEERQQHDGDEVLEPPRDVVAEVGAAGHHEPHTNAPKIGATPIFIDR